MFIYVYIIIDKYNMNDLKVNKTLIIQGTLTFVAAIACSDAMREITSVMKRDTVLENAILKTVIAGLIILVIFIISKIYQHKPEDIEDIIYEEIEIPVATANVVMKQSTLPDEAVIETYTNRDYSEYMSTFI